jgi:tRNA threonylcarbamoyladenosine biosynthesis protein TsaE
MREPRRLTLALADEAATRAAGAALAAALVAVEPASLFVTVAGELGAGKTTLVRGLLEALGVAGPVRSPTYTLIESYPAAGRRLHHLDWYRLTGADDLEGVGFRELLGPGHWVLAEWPERAPAVAAQADLALGLAYAASGRRLRARALSPQGAAVLARWRQGNA